MPVVRILFTCAALLGLVACADDDGAGASSAELEAITWILDEASAGGLAAGGMAWDPAEVRATLRFEDGEVGGSAFCNQYGGTYEADEDGSMSITVGAMTEMACDEPLMSLEVAFVEALGAVTGFEVADGSLRLTRDGGSDLTFGAEQPLPLVGTAWRLDGVGAGGDAVSSTLAGTEATATFDGHGSVAGRASCSQYGASYVVDGDAIDITDVMSTAMACEPPVMDQEAAFLAGLQDAARYQIEGSTLTLLDADGAYLLSLVAR